MHKEQDMKKRSACSVIEHFDQKGTGDDKKTGQESEGLKVEPKKCAKPWKDDKTGKQQR